MDLNTKQFSIGESGNVILTNKDPEQQDFNVDSEIDEDELNDINESYIIEDCKQRSQPHEDEWFAKDIHDNVKLELNPTFNSTFTEETIPCLIKNNEKKNNIPQKPLSSLTQEKKDYHKNLTQFTGKLIILNCANEVDDHTVYYYMSHEHDKLFKFPTDFNHYVHYRYIFFAEMSERFYNNKYVWNVIINRKYPLNVKSCEWSLYTWVSLMRKLYEKKPLKYRIEQFDSDIFLPQEIFPQYDLTQQPPLSYLYMTMIRPCVKSTIKSHIERMKDYKFFFFNEEILDMASTWVPSKESLLALNIDGLWILHNIFSEKGDFLIKKKFFKYLFFRPNEDIDLPDGNTMNIHQLFLCESNTGIKWDFPVFSSKDKKTLSDHVFSRSNRPPTTKLAQEFRLMCSIESQRKMTDTCVFYSDIYDIIMEESRKNSNLNPAKIMDKLCKLQSVKVIDHINNRDKSIVDNAFYKRSQMMEIALKTIFQRFLSNPSNDPRVRAKHYWPKEPHEFADKRYIKNQFELSGEQEKALFYTDMFPITLLDGKAGSGKTAVMNRFINRFHKHEVLYVSAVASTVQEVGAKHVTERSLTGSRCLILHNMFCLNICDSTQLKQTLFRLKNNRIDPKDPNQQFGIDEQIFKGCEYRCDQIQTCFNQCFLEKIRAIVFDETSMIDAPNFCRLIYLFSRCAHPDTRYLFGGDGSQFPSISAGNIHHDLGVILNPFKIEFKLDHRFVGEDAIINMSNARAIREHDYANLIFNMKTKFIPNSNYRYQPDPQPITDRIRYHFVELSECLQNEKEDNMIENLLKPTLLYLINQPEYLGRLKRYGENNDIHICCPTNKYKNIISKFICENVFMENAKNCGRRLNNLISNYGVKEDVFKGSKIIYKKNRYEEGIELYNNLIYIVYQIQDVQFKEKKKRKGKGSSSSSSSSSSHNSEYEDDIISETGDSSFLLNSGGTLSVERTSKEIKEEFDRFRNATPIQGHEDLPTTACFAPFKMQKGTYGRILRIVPASDVDSFGRVKTYDNERFIPWTFNHIPLVNRSTCSTTFSSQGRQCVTIIGFYPSFWKERDVNNSIYVTSTRAELRVVLVSTEAILQNIIENEGKKRKSHFPNYICPKIKEFIDHEYFKNVPIPEFIQKKLLQDDEKQALLDMKIKEFRRKTKEEISKPKPIPIPQSIPTSSSSSSYMSQLGKNSLSFFDSRARQPAKRLESEGTSSSSYEPISKRPHGSVVGIISPPKPLTIEQNPLLKRERMRSKKKKIVY